MLTKNVNNKKCAPKLIFFNEKKNEKDSDNFWYKKLTLKVKRLGDFALFDTSLLSQFSKFNNFPWVCWLLGKNLSNFVPPAWKLHNPYCHSAQFRNILHLMLFLYKFKKCWRKNEFDNAGLNIGRLNCIQSIIRQSFSLNWAVLNDVSEKLKRNQIQTRPVFLTRLIHKWNFFYRLNMM